MRIVHRLLAATVSTLVTGALLAVPASADQAESFVATGLARALNLRVLGISATVGASGMEMNSSPMAKADGAGVLLAPGTVSHAEASGPGVTNAPPKACLLNLPLADLIDIAAACGEARADTVNGIPQAFGQGTVAAIDIGGQQLLQLLTPVLGLLEPVLDQVLTAAQAVVGPVLGGLQLPVLGQLVGLDPGTGLVSDLVQAIQDATDLATVRLGASTVVGSTTVDKVTANATAQGGQIDVLPGLALGGAPLLSIVIGSSRATAVFDRTGANAGSSTPSFDAAIATVKLGLPILGGTVTEIPIRLGAPLTLLAGTPLESTISLGAGTTERKADGSVVAVADGVSLHLLKGVSGGILLELAHSEAAVGGQARIVTQQLQRAPEPVSILAKTGNDPWLPMAGATMLLAAYIGRRMVTPRPARTRETSGGSR